MHIYPSILVGTKEEAQQQLDISVEAGSQAVQVDIIDGLFADNATITPADMAELQYQDISVDLHLMTNEPMDYVHEAIEWESHIPVRVVIAQIERMTSQAQFIEEVKKHNWQVGLSLDLDTPIEEIEEDSWQRLDVIQLMSVRAGFQGQQFEQYVWEKLKELTHEIKLRGLTIHVFVDGGIKEEQLARLEQVEVVTGAAVGSAIWKSADPVKTLQEFNHSGE